jgi:O-antigen ligase
LNTNTLTRSEISLVYTPVVLGPWVFGAWEMWWFWPLATALFSAMVLFGIRVLRGGLRVPGEETASGCGGVGREKGATQVVRAWNGFVVSGLVFLAYAGVRTLQAPVFMDAERTFLLFLLPFFIGLHVVYGLTTDQRAVLCRVLVLNLVLLAVYGIVNHALTGSRWVLWAPGFEQYIAEHRASGSYYCPNHFAGIMEFLFGIGLAVLLSMHPGGRRRWMGLVLAGLAVGAIFLSKSRGGGLAVLVVAGAALVWGFCERRPSVRRWNRVSGLALGAIGVLLFCQLASGYRARFVSGILGPGGETRSVSEVGARVYQVAEGSIRGQLIGSAVRAWRTAPVFGIGPGMHQNLWPHFAATPDGDRERGIWPTHSNHQLQGDFVHSDWLQLLEEWGLVGFLLFLMAFTCLARVWHVGIGLMSKDSRARHWQGSRRWDSAVILGALFAFVAMGFHSLGDFNLQMPATGWILAALLGLGVSEVRKGDFPPLEGEGV